MRSFDLVVNYFDGTFGTSPSQINYLLFVVSHLPRFSPPERYLLLGGEDTTSG